VVAAIEAFEMVKVTLVLGVVLASDVVNVAPLIAAMVVPTGKPPPETEAPTTRPAVLAGVTTYPVASMLPVTVSTPVAVAAPGAVIVVVAAVVVAEVPTAESPAAL
jgi:hypothetical protein